LQSGRQFAAKLIERIAAFLRGSSFRQFGFLADDPYGQCDQDGGWNENRG
jgi:hypothetical protein